ncbi:hypothetical protein ABWH98_24530 [Labrenzia sp. ac12]
MANRDELKLLKLLRVNQAFMDLRPEMNLSLMSAFVAAIIRHPQGENDDAPTIKELSELAGVPYTSMSRHLRYLGDRERIGKPGLKLVEVRENPDNKREKMVYLTLEGEELRDKVFSLLC